MISARAFSNGVVVAGREAVQSETESSKSARDADAGVMGDTAGGTGDGDGTATAVAGEAEGNESVRLKRRL